MDRRNCSVLIDLVGDEVVPEFGGREAHGHYHRTFEEKGARKPARKPCTWKRGMTRSVRSFDVNLEVN